MSFSRRTSTDWLFLYTSNFTNLMPVKVRRDMEDHQWLRLDRYWFWRARKRTTSDSIP